MRGKRMKSRFFLIITFLCFGSLLNSFIWSNNNAELHQRPLQKIDISQQFDLCQGCREVDDKVPESNSEISNFQEDKPTRISRHLSNVEPQPSESCKGCRQDLDKAMERKQEDDSQKIREVIEKGTESDSEISKTQEDKPRRIREVIEETVERKQDNNSQKMRKVIEKGTESDSEISKTQEDKPRRKREVIDKAVERKQEDDSRKFRKVIEKGTESDSKILKTQEDKPRRKREVVDKAVERKQEDDSGKKREVIEKGTESDSENSKTQEDKPKRIRRIIRKVVVVRRIKNPKKQEDNPQQIRKENDKVEDLRSQNLNIEEKDSQKMREVIDKAVEQKKKDDSQKIREVIEKGTESDSENSKIQEDKPKRIRKIIRKAAVRSIQNSKKEGDNPQQIKKENDKVEDLRPQNLNMEEKDSQKMREVVDKAVEQKKEDDSQKIREVIEKGTESDSKNSKIQEDKTKRIRKVIRKVAARSIQNSNKQEDNPQQIKKENKVEDLRPQNSNTEKDDSQIIREVIDKAVERYSQTWKKQEDNSQKLRSNMTSQCNGLDKAIITQNSAPVGSNISYNGLKKTLQVTPEIFSTFTKDPPFANKTWDTCAVVGNGGILINSSCGQTIDSAQFVIRCNLPPLANGYEKHVGIKTDLVTANPSIFVERYGALMGRRRPFMESLRSYGNSLLLLPAFSYSSKTILSLRAIYTVEDFESPIRPVFLNPEYVENLLLFWRSQGLRETRLSTGLTMVSLALELCNNVHLYGFWPFSNHPHDSRNLTNHYYDDIKPKVFHAMPDEFDLLMRLHSQGILKLHLGDCPTSGK